MGARGAFFGGALQSNLALLTSRITSKDPPPDA
jgi:hypothetical protein